MPEAQQSLSFMTRSGMTIQERWEDFHERHPEVMGELVRLADQVRMSRKKCGIRMLWERMRWTFFFERDMEDEFRLNDHYTSRYVRQMLKDHPEFEGMFELRELRAE